ncbi:MAG: hypothetical protein ACRC0F_01830 [Cetobacterium sp.]
MIIEVGKVYRIKSIIEMKVNERALYDSIALSQIGFSRLMDSDRYRGILVRVTEYQPQIHDVCEYPNGEPIDSIFVECVDKNIPVEYDARICTWCSALLEPFEEVFWKL